MSRTTKANRRMKQRTCEASQGCLFECSTLILLRLIFAFHSHIVSPPLPGPPNPAFRPGRLDRQEVRRASAHETSARNPGLPQRVHPAARVRPEPRGNRAPLQPVVAGHGAQAPHEPPGKGLHPPRLEPQPIGGGRADAGRRPRARAAAARLRGRRRPDRGGRQQRDDRGARRRSSASATATCCASRATR